MRAASSHRHYVVGGPVSACAVVVQTQGPSPALAGPIGGSGVHARSASPLHAWCRIPRAVFHQGLLTKPIDAIRYFV